MSTATTTTTGVKPQANPVPPTLPTLEARYALLTRYQTLLTPSTSAELKTLLTDMSKTPKLAWGYLIPLAKLLDFLRGGISVTILMLSTYGHMINHPTTPPAQIAHRASYYKHLIQSILSSLGISPTQYTFVDETSYTFTHAFMTDMYATIALMKQQDARDTGEEVRGSEWLSPLLTPVLQTLSEVYLDLDIQFGGEDQRGLFKHSETFLPLLNHRRRIHIMNRMLPSLYSPKMSSSHPAHTKIGFLDSPATVRDKVSRAPCDPTPETPILALLRDVLWPMSEQRVERRRGDVGANPEERCVPQWPFCSEDAPDGTVFSISLPDSRMHYTSYAALEADFFAGVVRPDALKEAVIDAVNGLLAPIRQAYAESEEWRAVEKLAYPDEEAAVLC
ncbi:MAG: hypothetical protein M1840_004819 [Geoglossum simile]|nr:MAG: hypothetical protein M1840_004819 [Geoglossum simile]